MFHSEGRSTLELLSFMPRSRIWDVEGRVQGTNLGNMKFQFDIKKEGDLLKEHGSPTWIGKKTCTELYESAPHTRRNLKVFINHITRKYISRFLYGHLL